MSQALSGQDGRPAKTTPSRTVRAMETPEATPPRTVRAAGTPERGKKIKISEAEPR
jgi:hypothetical protein